MWLLTHVLISVNMFVKGAQVMMAMGEYKAVVCNALSAHGILYI